MPPKPAGGVSNHTRRMDALRPRVVDILKNIPVPEGQSRPTRHGLFARTCKEIADRDNRRWHAGGAKDASRSIRLFAEGKQGMSFERLEVVELACIEWESRFREEKLARAMSHFGPSSALSSESPEPIVVGAEDEDTREVEERRHLALVPDPLPMIHPATGDPEIDAMAAIKNILDPLNDDQVKRVVSYIMSRREIHGA